MTLPAPLFLSQPQKLAFYGLYHNTHAISILFAQSQSLLGLAGNYALFQFFKVINPYFCHTDFAPAGLDAAGHMLEVIVIEKDTFQVVFS